MSWSPPTRRARSFIATRQWVEMMRQAEADIRHDLPTFARRRDSGPNFDLYHWNPPISAICLPGFVKVYRTELTIGGRHFALVAAPIVNSQGASGDVVEWRDRTAEVRSKARFPASSMAAGWRFQPTPRHRRHGRFLPQAVDGHQRPGSTPTAAALTDVPPCLNRSSEGDLRQDRNRHRGMLGN